MQKYIMAIDQGTTSTRAVLFDHAGGVVAYAQKEFQQFFPENGWVEHDPVEIWQTTHSVCRQIINEINEQVASIAAIGITNQRETTILWNKRTGKPVYRAIVWQDRRTADFCAHEKKQNPTLERWLQEKTGLLLDPYFSATKIAWILKHVPEAQQLAKRDELAFGTVDSYLLWHLTGGKKHATDITNAARTLLFNIHTLEWDQELLDYFEIPRQILPEVKENMTEFGMTDSTLFGQEIPITGMAGDQQSAAFGQLCFTKGMVKSTFGTGCFILVNTGNEAICSKNRLLTTILTKNNGQVQYALEGSIFNAGAIVKWFRDQLQIIRHAKETESLAASISSNDGVYLVPAFTGLGAPYWQPNLRAAILGMTRNTNSAHLVRAGLEAVCYQTLDLLTAMKADGVPQLDAMRVDGGMVNNRWMMQFLSDILNLTVEQPVNTEITALGAAYMAGLKVGFYESLDKLHGLWQRKHSFKPKMSQQEREKLYAGWLHSVNQIGGEKL